MSSMPQSASSTLPPLGEGVTRLSIRNMVCLRCVRMVQRELERAGLVVEATGLGMADVRTAARYMWRRRRARSKPTGLRWWTTRATSWWNK